MLDLHATPPVTAGLPLTIGTLTLSQTEQQDMWSIAPYHGAQAVLEAALGQTLPKQGRRAAKAGVELTWFSREEWMLMGASPAAAAAEHGAITDQSDAWCVLEIAGARVEEALARLVPVDLRAGIVKRGHCLRSQLNHMNVHITRLGGDRFRIMGMRSMAGTMVHELTSTMQNLAARG